MTLPRKSTLISNIQRGEDSRGDILSIVNVPIKNVSIINCNPGSIRSNHYHLKDFHYMYVLEGTLTTFTRMLTRAQFAILRSTEVKLYLHRRWRFMPVIFPTKQP